MNSPERDEELRQMALELQRKLLEQSVRPNNLSMVQTERQMPSRNITNFLKNAWTACTTAAECSFCYDEHSTIDILFRALVFGWTEALEVHSLHCRHWITLREIDTQLLVPGGMPRCERFGVMYLGFIHAAQPKQDSGRVFRQPPRWLKPRPSQERFGHDKIIDLIIWPTLRERLVLEHAAGLSDVFVMSYVANIRFYWPYKFTAAFAYDAKTLQYRLKHFMQASLEDVNHWRVTDAFIRQFPQYEEDVIPMHALPAFLLHWRGTRTDSEDAQGKADDERSLASSVELAAATMERGPAGQELGLSLQDEMMNATSASPDSSMVSQGVVNDAQDFLPMGGFWTDHS